MNEATISSLAHSLPSYYPQFPPHTLKTSHQKQTSPTQAHYCKTTCLTPHHSKSPQPTLPFFYIYTTDPLRSQRNKILKQKNVKPESHKPQRASRDLPRRRAVQAKVSRSPQRDLSPKRAPPSRRRRRGRLQPHHRVRVAQAEAQEGAPVPLHRPKRLVRQRGHGLCRGPPHEEAHWDQDQGAPHLGLHFRHLHRRSQFG